VISYPFNQRVREIRIRMALGASATDLQRRIVLRTHGLAAIGHPVTFIGVGALLIAVAAIAGYTPA